MVRRANHQMAMMVLMPATIDGQIAQLQVDGLADTALLLEMARLDLQTRLLKYRLSYMLYSEVFETLPATAKAAVFERLWAVLGGADQAPRYKVLPMAERSSIVEILRETKDDLPAYFVRPLR